MHLMLLAGFACTGRSFGTTGGGGSLGCWLGFPFVISHGLCQWPLVPVLVRNATLVVSETV
jgi:hypothetical protein